MTRQLTFIERVNKVNTERKLKEEQPYLEITAGLVQLKKVKDVKLGKN